MSEQDPKLTEFLAKPRSSKRTNIEYDEGTMKATDMFKKKATNRQKRLADASVHNGSVANKVCLIVIDGWGISEDPYGNAILNARTPVMDKLCSGNWAQIEAHGLHVGLPEGVMGNSEVGHLNIGAGRVIYQDIVRINLACKNNQLVNNESLVDACNRAKSGNGRLHLAGLVSDGGVHSHIDHMYALIKAIKELGVPELYLHFYGDGRDTSPNSGVGFLQQTLDFLEKTVGYGKLATVVGRYGPYCEGTTKKVWAGRYYAMDRDKNWGRIKIAYEAMIVGVGENSDEAGVVEVVRKRYAADETDEFLSPIILQGENGRVKNDDTLIFTNFSPIRMRQISEVMGKEAYLLCKSNFPHPSNVQVYGMTQYKAAFHFKSLFPPASNKNVLSEWLDELKISQSFLIETENKTHFTYFLNGCSDKKYNGIVYDFIQSPTVATYDSRPEMSVEDVASRACHDIEAGTHPLIMCNFAPPGAVGHTGVYEAAVEACEATDIAIGRIYEATQKHGYSLMVTAGHGNAEKMKAPDGGKHTAHTCYRVPLTLSHSGFEFVDPADRHPALCDVAPTVLAIMGLPQPAEMTGVSIVRNI